MRLSTESAADFAAFENRGNARTEEQGTGCSTAGAGWAEQADDTAARETEAEESLEGVASRSWLEQRLRCFSDALAAGLGVVT